MAMVTALDSFLQALSAIVGGAPSAKIDARLQGADDSTRWEIRVRINQDNQTPVSGHVGRSTIDFEAERLLT